MKILFYFIYLFIYFSFFEKVSGLNTHPKTAQGQTFSLTPFEKHLKI